MCSGGGAAQAQDQDSFTIALDEDGFNETVREGAMISGSVVAGAMVHEGETGELSLQGYIPADWNSRQVCAQLTSIDGLYEAIGRYNVPSAWAGGIASLEFPTKHPALLKGAPQDGLAIRVTPGACGGAQSSEITVALWNADELGPVNLLLNSFRADSVFVYVGDLEAPIRCDPIALPGRTAFDSKCALNLEGHSGAVDLTIYRIVDGKPAPPDPLTIRWPGTDR